MGDRGILRWRAGGVRPGSRDEAMRRTAPHRELVSKLATLQKEYADLRSALFEAGQVHRRLCAPRLLRYGAFEIASEVFAVRYLPGDFFTVENAEGRAVLALGDVCGKGLAAGMWTPCVVGLVRAHAAASSDPQTIVSGVNREFSRMQAPLTSLFVATLDPDSGTLDYCSAGHPPALVLRASGRLETLSEGGMLLGMIADAPFRRSRVILERGDVLVAYTDGVIEASNDADEEFGCERLEAQLRLAYGPADALLFSLLGSVEDFAAPNPLADDTSLVVVRHGGLPLQPRPIEA